jgi:hypothetical protein
LKGLGVLGFWDLGFREQVLEFRVSVSDFGLGVFRV